MLGFLLAVPGLVLPAAEGPWPTTAADLVGWRFSTITIPRGMVLKWSEWIAVERGPAGWTALASWNEAATSQRVRWAVPAETTEALDRSLLALAQLEGKRPPHPHGERIPRGGCSPSEAPDPWFLESLGPQRTITMLTGADLAPWRGVVDTPSRWLAHLYERREAGVRLPPATASDQLATWTPMGDLPGAGLVHTLSSYPPEGGWPAGLPFNVMEVSADRRTCEWVDWARLQALHDPDYPERLHAMAERCFGPKADPEATALFGSRLMDAVADAAFREPEPAPFVWDLLCWLDQHRPTDATAAIPFEFLAAQFAACHRQHPAEVEARLIVWADQPGEGHLDALNLLAGLNPQVARLIAVRHLQADPGWRTTAAVTLSVLGLLDPSALVAETRRAPEAQVRLCALFTAWGFLPTPEYVHAGMPGFSGMCAPGWVDELLRRAAQGDLELVAGSMVDDPRLVSERDLRSAAGLPTNLVELPGGWLSILNRLAPIP